MEQVVVHRGFNPVRYRLMKDQPLAPKIWNRLNPRLYERTDAPLVALIDALRDVAERASPLALGPRTFARPSAPGPTKSNG